MQRISVVAFALVVACAPAEDRGTARVRHEQQNRPPLAGETVSILPLDAACPRCEYANAVYVVSEPEFLTALAAQSAFSNTELRRFGAELAAIARQTSTLGVLADPSSQTTSASVWVVARDFSVLDGQVETRDFYVALADLSVDGAFGLAPRFALSSATHQPPDCESEFNGCRPITVSSDGVESIHIWADSDKGATVPPDVTLNAEQSQPTRGNGSGYRPELRLYWNEREPVSNRFECSGAVELSACDNLHRRPARQVAEASESTLALQSAGAVGLVREADLGLLLATGEPASERVLNDAVSIATTANSPGVVGITAEPVFDGEVDVELLIVARDLAFDVLGNLQSTQYYVVPWRSRSPIPVFGSNVKFGFTTPLPTLPRPVGACGLISSFKELGYCGPLECLPGPTYLNPHFGEERWSRGDSRTTLRVPAGDRPGMKLAVYACNEVQPPPTGVPICRNQPESCNGVDDNCNGAIDEGGVCETRCSP